MEQNSGVGLNLEIKLYTTSRGSDMTRQKIRKSDTGHMERPGGSRCAQLFTDDGKLKIFFAPRRKMLNLLYGEYYDKCARPPWCHDGEGISCDILTQDHNALSYRNGRLIILPTPSHFSHIYQNNVRFNMFEDTKYHGYSSNICPLKLKFNQE